MRPATAIVHGSQGRRPATPIPLTTPIYETTTFVFESAAEVRAYNEGRSKKFLYSRYGNPTVVAVEQTIAGARRGRDGDAAGERHGGDVHGAARAAEGGRRSRLQRRDLRRHAAPAGGSVSALRHPGAVRRPSRSCGSPIGVHRRPDRRCSGSSRRSTRRSAASTSRRSPPRAGRAGVDLDHRQHVRQPAQPAADRARRRHRDAQRHQVPQRPQRRDRRARSPGRRR